MGLNKGGGAKNCNTKNVVDISRWKAGVEDFSAQDQNFECKILGSFPAVNYDHCHRTVCKSDLWKLGENWLKNGLQLAAKNHPCINYHPLIRDTDS